ncbi:MAG: Tryptophan synthase alpha chain, partial [Myxococcaceae bacterium]|nr:Tryptophan synthase alpha chain [Myxococcaceae bacterium]
TSASLALLCVALLLDSCGSPVVGLECRQGFERCGLACYDLTSDNAHCGSCGISCGEGQQCVESMCMLGFLLPDGGFQHTDGGDGGPGMDAQIGDGGPGDGGPGMDGSSDIPDGAIVKPDGQIVGPDGGIYTPPDSGPLTDGGGGLQIPDGAIIEADGAIILPDGGFFTPDGGTTPPVPPLCMGVVTDPTCVCDLGQTNCNQFCVDTSTDHDNCGACGNVCMADEYCSGGTCALVCTPPLILCNALCVDFTSDDANCGSCGHACGSAAACIYDPTTMNGACVGKAVGHVVVVGHDMSVVTKPIRQMVGNAVFLSPHNPVRVLAYDANTSVPSRVGTSLAIQQSSSAIGRAYSLNTADPSNVTQQLGDADVFVIEAQQAATNTDLQTLGVNWSAALHTFLFRGGVILLFEGDGSNDGTYQILNAATSPPVAPALVGDPLFRATGRQPLSQRILGLATASDAIAAAVPTEYQSQGVTSGFVGVPSNANTANVIIDAVPLPTTPPTPATMLPVVIHTVTSN